MDRPQAILLIKDHMEHHKIGAYPHILLGEALNMAIAALSKPSNEPLSIEQLREMDGEPVYIHSDIFPEDCGWRVIARADVLRIYFTDRTSLSLTDYDKSWIAYRRPPEGEEDT